MKKVALLTLTATLLLSACNQQQRPSDALSLPDNLKGDKTVVAKVGGKEVYQSEFASYVKSRTQQDLDSMNEQVQKQLFDEFIQLEALSRKAANMKLNESDEFGLSVHNLKKNLLAQALLKKYEEDNPISDADITAEYENAKAEFEIPQIKARHILVKTVEEANAIIEQLKKEADFAKLAIEKSTGPSGPKGGDLGWFAATQMVKPFADAVVAMEDGTFSQSPVETQFGFLVIKKEGERVGEAPPLENLKPRLEQKLKQDKLETYLESIQSELGVEELFTAKAPDAVAEDHTGHDHDAGETPEAETK